MTHSAEASESPRAAALKEKLAPLTEEISAFYAHQAQLLSEGKLDDSPHETVDFDGVRVEMADRPSLAIVTGPPLPYAVLVAPRLELHLEGSPGLHHARTQLGRIARYIEARQLEEAFPTLATITYPQLSKIARRVVGPMVPALAVYSPGIDDTAALIRYAHRSFLEKHGHAMPSDPGIDAAITATSVFIERWREHL